MPGRLQSMGYQRVGGDLVTKQKQQLLIVSKSYLAISCFHSFSQILFHLAVTSFLFVLLENSYSSFKVQIKYLFSFATHTHTHTHTYISVVSNRYLFSCSEIYFQVIQTGLSWASLLQAVCRLGLFLDCRFALKPLLKWQQVSRVYSFGMQW